MSIRGFIGWVRGGHPRDAGGTPQKVKSAKRGDSDSESESEQETVAQRRLREHEELHGPRASAVVEGGAGASMEVEVLRNEADPVLVRLNGNEVIQYPMISTSRTTTRKMTRTTRKPVCWARTRMAPWVATMMRAPMRRPRWRPR